MRQGGLEADVRAADQAIGDQKGMRPDLLVGQRKGIEPAPQLVQAARGRPARELAAHARRVDRVSEERSRLKDGLLAYDVEQCPVVHTRSILQTASYCNHSGTRSRMDATLHRAGVARAPHDGCAGHRVLGQIWLPC